MIVAYVGPSGLEWAAARDLVARSPDQTFSIAELAAHLETTVSSATAIADVIYRRGLGGRVADDWSRPPSPDDPWYLVRNEHLTSGREYDVLTIEDDWYRILNDRDDPVLHHASVFEVRDSQVPASWVTRFDADGCRCMGPPKWLEPGFFEAYHDRDSTIRDEFWRALRNGAE